MQDAEDHDETEAMQEPKRRRRLPVPAENTSEQAVTKANEAIAIRPRRGKLTLLSLRIYNVLIYHAQQLGLDNKSYTIQLSELIHDARFTSNNTQLLKNHIRDMQTTLIEWYTTTATNGRDWESTQLLGPVTIHEPGRGKACSITWSFPEKIQEKLLRPTQYTRILLEISSQMRSYAAASLYELGRRYLTSPGQLTMREDVLWWASVLTGRSDIKTVDYRIFHRDTIKKALVELDALSDEFKLELVEHKRGRKVEELQFRVIQKPQQSLTGLKHSDKNIFDLQLIEKIIAFGIKRADAQDLYVTTDEGVLRATVTYVEQRLKNDKLEPLKSAAAFFKDALKKRYAGLEPDLPAEDAKPAKSAAEKLSELREALQHQRSLDAEILFAELPKVEQEKLMEQFQTERIPDLPSPIRKAWLKEKLETKLTAAAFFMWVSRTTWPAEPTDKELLEFAISRSEETLLS